jgi:hypothetical protein
MHPLALGIQLLRKQRRQQICYTQGLLVASKLDISICLGVLSGLVIESKRCSFRTMTLTRIVTVCELKGYLTRIVELKRHDNETVPV